MNKINVSVIIPYYKSKDTIDRAVDSVLNQTVLPKEIIIIDDYSDNYEDEEKLKELSENELVNLQRLNENSGPGIARNVGINHATSKYIAFLDSDDSWHSKKLEIQYKIMENSNADISVHKSKKLDNSTVQDELINIKGISIRKINKHRQLLKNQFSTRSVMMKREPNYLFSNKRRAEDYLYWSQLMLSGKTAIKIEKVLAFSYKDHYGDSGLTKSLWKMYLGGIDADLILLKTKKISIITFGLLTIIKTIKFIIRILRFLSKRR